MGAQQGYFVLADISGYTSYMAGTELEHAQEITHEIISNLIAHLVPPLDLAEVEGDAVFVYAPSDRIGRGETLLEVVEAAYLAFRHRRDSMQARTTCVCRACQAIPTLDLKFITHLGSYVLQEIAGKKKPVGSDINLAHRLLKNHTAEASGWRAYSLFTKEALKRLGIWPENMHEQREEYEHFPTVTTESVNLHDRYAVLNEQRRVELRPDEYDDEVTVEIRVQPPTVWEWINDPRRRNEANVEDGVNWSARRRPGGRTAVGATNHCDHGGGTADEQILDWKPFEYYSSSFKSGPLRLIMTWELQAIPDGTRLTWRGKVEQKMPRFLARLIMKKGVKGDVILGKIKSAIETDVATAEGKV